MTNSKTNQMGESHNAGPLSTILSIVFGFFALVTMKDVQVWVSITAGAIGAVAGAFAIYNHYLSIKEKKQNLKS